MRTGHQHGEVFLECSVIEFLEFLGIVEPFSIGLDLQECWCRILRFSCFGHQSAFDWALTVVRVPRIAANGHWLSLLMNRSFLFNQAGIDRFMIDDKGYCFQEIEAMISIVYCYGKSGAQYRYHALRSRHSHGNRGGAGSRARK